jgi:hypothetical protein
MIWHGKLLADPWDTFGAVCLKFEDGKDSHISQLGLDTK